MFLAYMSGDFGKAMVAEFVKKLSRFRGALFSTAQTKDYFVLSVIQIGEAWRRFIHRLEGFPAKMFRLCDLELDALCVEIGHLQKQAKTCGQCLDVEFSKVLLDYIPPIDPGNTEHQHRALQVQNFLVDVATYGPVSSDPVEALHGFSQAKLHRFRGCKPTDEVAKEITVWAKITSSFGALKKWIWDRTGDPHAARRLSAMCRRSSNNVFTKGRLKQTEKTRLTFSHLRKMAQDPNGHVLKHRKLSGVSVCHFSYFKLLSDTDTFLNFYSTLHVAC